MPSATEQARTQAPPVSPPPAAQLGASSSASVEAWIMALPAPVRQTLMNRLTRIVQAMPSTLQLAYLRTMAASGHPNPIPVAAAGLGQWGDVALAIAPSLISAAAQTGTQLYLTRQSNDLQRQLQGNALQTDATIAAAQIEAQRQTQLAFLQAQTDAAKIAGQAMVGQAGINAAARVANAPLWSKTILWVGLGALALGGGALLYRAKRARS